MRWSYTDAALFAATTDLGLIGNIGIALEVFKNGDLSGVENAESSGKKSLLGDLDLSLKVLSDCELLRTKRSGLRTPRTWST